MIAAGFLHDVVEDTDVTIEELEQRFSEVRQLVEGVTKLSKFNFSSKTRAKPRISVDVPGNGTRYP